jgi:hypothetical protein
VRLRLESRGVRLLVSALTGTVAALAVSLGNLWLKCLQPASEACVWTRAYLPLSLAVTFAILGVPVFVVTLVLLGRYASTRRR